MDYEIIATLGPSSESAELWREMLASGASALRLNTSHLDLDRLHVWLERLTPFLKACEEPRPPLVLDLQGSKWRLGSFEKRKLEHGRMIDLVHASTSQRSDELPVPHADFFQAAAESSGEIVLNDARICLALTSIGEGRLGARVIKGGDIAPRKGITYTASGFRCEGLNPKDHAIMEQTRAFAGIRYAVSYVRDAQEMARYRSQCGASSYLIAKLERGPAIDDARSIAAYCDELWLCRGDLGAELGTCAMAQSVHRFSRRLADLPAPVMLAGQVLEHMTSHAHPTRSEICHLYDALALGYRGIVLSDETAVGLSPVEACGAAAQFLSPGSAES